MGDGRFRVFAGSAAPALSTALAKALDAPLGRFELRRFPDGEAQAEVTESLAGLDAVLVQSFTAPAAERLLELLLLAEGCRRASAARVLAVTPYMAYARQDRAAREGQAVGGPLFAALVSSGRFDRLVAADLHAEAGEGWFTVPLTQVSAIDLLATAVRPFLPRDAVAVSPDLGGAKRADRFARALGLPLAIVHKTRQDGRSVVVHRVLGDVRGRPIVLVDDMIATGGTIEAAVGALREAGCAANVCVATTHAVLAEDAVRKLANCGLSRLFCTDSVPVPASLPFEVTVASLTPLLAAALGR